MLTPCDNAALSTTTPLRAVLSVSNTSWLPDGAPSPLLQGQTQASAFHNGTISIADLSLVAVPGTYQVTVTLPSYQQVRSHAYSDKHLSNCCTYTPFESFLVLHKNPVTLQKLHIVHAYNLCLSLYAANTSYTVGVHKCVKFHRLVK